MTDKNGDFNGTCEQVILMYSHCQDTKTEKVPMHFYLSPSLFETRFRLVFLVFCRRQLAFTEDELVR